MGLGKKNGSLTCILFKLLPILYLAVMVAVAAILDFAIGQKLSRETSPSYGVQDNWNLFHYVHEVMDHFGINCYHFSRRRQYKISWVPLRGKKPGIILKTLKFYP